MAGNNTRRRAKLAPVDRFLSAELRGLRIADYAADVWAEVAKFAEGHGLSISRAVLDLIELGFEELEYGGGDVR